MSQLNLMSFLDILDHYGAALSLWWSGETRATNGGKMRKGKKVLALLLSMGLFVGCGALAVGCATSGDAAAPTDALADTEGKTSEKPTPAEWAASYPDEYASFMSGIGDVKGKDGKLHSHASLRQKCEKTGGGVYAATDGGAGCIACKSSAFNDLYDEYGEDLWSVSYKDIAADIDAYWDCYMCHENEPGTQVTGAIMSYRELVGDDYFNSLDPGDQACGQCHNILGGYTRRLAAVEGNDLTNLEPYRYGTDPDAIYKAFIEDGDTLKVDEDGVEYFYAGHPDVEIFQGSTHESLGLTCASCHMPSTQNEDGKAYTNHNASGSPLENEDALEYCLTCHKAQGIDDTEAMVKFVKDKQAESRAQYDAAQEKIDELHDLIVAGGVDDQTDKQAREIYIKARWYQGYANGDAGVPGSKVPHAADAMAGYYQQSIDTAEEGIALFE